MKKKPNRKGEQSQECVGLVLKDGSMKAVSYHKANVFLLTFIRFIEDQIDGKHNKGMIVQTLHSVSDKTIRSHRPFQWHKLAIF